MALNWSLGDIADWETVCQVIADCDDRMNGITKGDTILSTLTRQLIFATMSVDMGRITEKNHEEFFSRLRLLEQLNGPFLWRADCDQGSWKNYITLDEVKAHIGLSTNVTTVAQSTWIKRIIDVQMRDNLRRAKQA